MDDNTACRTAEISGISDLVTFNLTSAVRLARITCPHPRSGASLPAARSGDEASVEPAFNPFSDSLHSAGENSNRGTGNVDEGLTDCFGKIEQVLRGVGKDAAGAIKGICAALREKIATRFCRLNIGLGCAYSGCTGAN